MIIRAQVQLGHEIAPIGYEIAPIMVGGAHPDMLAVLISSLSKILTVTGQEKLGPFKRGSISIGKNFQQTL
jgi:hypothetical protein